MADMQQQHGHYEVRENHSNVRGVLAVLWVQPGQPPSIMFTISAERLPLLAAALARYLAGGPEPRPPAA